jgi:hypothetical protein
MIRKRRLPLPAREAIARRVTELRTRLAATATTELERVLIDRLALAWLEVHAAGLHLAERLAAGGGATPAALAAQKILDKAHGRFLSAARCLARWSAW